MAQAPEPAPPPPPAAGLTGDQEELLALRITRRSLTMLAALAAPFVTGAALFGYHSAGEIRERRAAFGAYVDSARRQIDAEVANAHGLRDSLQLLSQSLRMLVAQAEQQSGVQAEVFRTAVGAYQQQVGAQLTQSSQMLSGMAEQRRQADSALAAVRGTLQQLDGTRRRVDTSLQTVAALRGDVRHVRHHLDSLERRLLNSGTVVVKEGNPLDIYGVGLWMRYDRLADNDVVGLTVRDTETDEVLVRPRRLRIGQSLDFASRRAQFRVTPRYRVKGRFLGRDMVGVHVEQFAGSQVGPVAAHPAAPEGGASAP